ncbi:hypothetical protein QBC44DRAFT_303083 [Cladorrhinum sp. PSN332]|nr:hypothetical protein QBC44DRAFT_303083 [Cladorrhinum sp. PSN332]
MATTAFFHVRFALQDDPGLYLVYPRDDGQECQCDIFVVHGWRGGATKTWRHRRTGIVWFNDLLPNLLRSADADTARIWTFGYPASLSFQTSTIHSFAQNLLHSVKNARTGQEHRKIIWVCHSLGGIVVKKALIDASLDPQYQSIRNATTGIVFLGTPHRGSAAADLGGTIANVVAAAIPGFRILNRDLLNNLRRNNQTLIEISGNFSRICASINIHSFFETVPQGGQVIVDSTSAILDLTNETVRFGLNSNHQDLGKFRDQFDSNWIAVSSSIRELVLMTNSYQRSPPPRSLINSYPPPPPPPRPAPAPRQSPAGAQPPPGQQTWEGQTGWGQTGRGQTGRGQPSSTYPTQNSSQSQISFSPESQSAPRQPQTKQSPRESRPPTPRAPDPDDPEVELCDVCMESIRSSDPKVQCTECYDYDLCLACYQKGRVSKSHKTSHKVSHVSYTELVSFDDMIPVSESVNPVTCPAPDGRVNWTVSDIAPNTPWNNTDHTISYRVLHLYENDSHARFLAHCKPGHYGVAMDIDLEFASALGAQARQTLLARPESAGRLRVTIGKIKNTQQFFGTKFEQEDSFTDETLMPNSLPSRLLEPGFWGGISPIRVDQAKIIFQSGRILDIHGRRGASVAIGIIVQWSQAAFFAAPWKDPVVSLSLGPIRLFNVVSYSEPYIRAPPPPEATAAPDPPPPPPATQREDESNYEADREPSVEEFLQALLQIRQEVQNREERARLEALVRIELQRQDQAKKEAVASLYMEAMQEMMNEALAEEQRRRGQEELESR